jgi:hypothetical protein
MVQGSPLVQAKPPDYTDGMERDMNILPVESGDTATTPLAPAADPDLSRPQVTQRLVRGVLRFFRAREYAALPEFDLANGRRADVLAIGRNGNISIIEVKSSPEDFRSDHKWHHYLDFCDWFGFAVQPQFPRGLLPSEAGVLVADSHGAVIVRPPADRSPLSPGRRKSLMLTFIHAAANRLAPLTDPLDPGLRGSRGPFVPSSR